ncbi:hypothetical protein [Paenibacillus sp. Y412MC10]|uniref:hypothetical protein n=1 Tax=Geobacillus sp. (strain Y412MC10) TaxID=481743 RepID=UPI0011AB7C03|nr:hypothetical protein [Paenibacillus sp. Y412MC10]
MNFLKLFLFRTVYGVLKFLFLKRYRALFWLGATITSFILLMMLATPQSADTYATAVTISFMMWLISLIDRIMYKRLTKYVILNRFSGTIHMSADISASNGRRLRAILPVIIQEFVTVGIPMLNPNRTYKFKTHQLILNELLKHSSYSHKLIGRGLLLEKSTLLPWVAIFNKKLRKRHFYKHETKYEVTILGDDSFHSIGDQSIQ